MKLQVVCALLLLGLFASVHCDNDHDKKDQQEDAQDEVKPEPLPEWVEIVEAKESCDRRSKKGDLLNMHYTGTLEDGKKFDSSLDRGEPFQFQLGEGQVIQGWDIGLIGMCVGDKRKLTIPSELGYGDRGAGEVIPPKATLIFDVEVMGITDGKTAKNVFNEIDQDGDKMLSQDEVSEFITRQQQEAGMEEPIEGQQHYDMVREIFQHEDKDKDGFISHKEFSGPKHDEL